MLGRLPGTRGDAQEAIPVRALYGIIASMHRGFFAVAAGFFCFAGTLAAVPDAVVEASQHAERGAQCAQTGDMACAEAELRRAVELAPNNASYLTSLGGILGMQQKLAEANVYFERAVKSDSNDPTSRRNLAANEWRLGKLKQAQANLERLLQMQPQDKAARLLLGMVSENEHEYTRAAKLLASVPELVDQRPESIAALASSYYHTGRRDDAHKVLEALLGRSASPEGIFAAAGVAAQAEDYEIAEKLFESIRYSYPDITVLEYNLALIELRTGRIARSQRTLQEIVNAGHAKGEIYNLLGMVEMKVDQFTDAVQCYSRAVELDPNSLDAKVGLASAKWAAGMRPQAEAEFQALLKEHPGDATVYESYGTSLLNSASEDTMLERAAALLKHAAKLDDSRAEVHYQLGILELKKNPAGVSSDSLHQALEQLQKSVRLGLTGSKVHYALARVYRRLGRENDAATEMRLYQESKAAEDAPDASHNIAAGPAK